MEASFCRSHNFLPVMKTLQFLIFISLCHPAFSRVGETMDECKTRYGPPIGRLEEEVQFKKNGLDVFISFHGGKASGVRYSGEITYAMAEELLKANGGDKKWLVTWDEKALKRWKTEDKLIEANFAYATKDDVAQLIIIYRPLVDAEREVQKEAERKKVEGF